MRAGYGDNQPTGTKAEGRMSAAVIVSGARTPVGRLLGSLKDFTAMDLGGIAIKAALERAGISGDQVEYVIMGQVLQAAVAVISFPPLARYVRMPQLKPPDPRPKEVPFPLDDRAHPAHALP